jgi:hypothetical protein
MTDQTGWKVGNFSGIKELEVARERLLRGEAVADFS